MAIHIPGKRDKRNKVTHRRGEVNASMTLTPLVDMFTILVVFLLMNYSSTGEIIYIPKDVKLPKASQTKELKPAHIVTVTTKDIVLDRTTVASLADVQAQKDWMIPRLRDELVKILKDDDVKAKQQAKLRQSLGAPVDKTQKETENNPRKITVQADRDLEFLTVKKIMFTVTEAGAQEINFAVMKKDENQQQPVTQ
jgi:biopolymer transport protein ExbD